MYSISHFGNCELSQDDDEEKEEEVFFADFQAVAQINSSQNECVYEHWTACAHPFNYIECYRKSVSSANRRWAVVCVQASTLACQRMRWTHSTETKRWTTTIKQTKRKWFYQRKGICSLPMAQWWNGDLRLAAEAAVAIPINSGFHFDHQKKETKILSSSKLRFNLFN